MLRPATPDDIPTLVELGRVMHDESPVFRALSFSEDKLARTILHAIDNGFAVVAEQGGQIVGGMLGIAVEHWASTDVVACDLALFVAPEHRGGSTGARLLRRYAEWAESIGAAITQFGIVTGVEPERTEELCRCLGWRRTGVVMGR